MMQHTMFINVENITGVFNKLRVVTWIEEKRVLRRCNYCVGNKKLPYVAKSGTVKCGNIFELNVVLSKWAEMSVINISKQSPAENLTVDSSHMNVDSYMR